MSAACETKHDSPVAAGGSGSGEIMLFGVRLLVDSMRKSVSLNNLSQYMHPQEMYSTGNGNAAAAAGYASMDEAAHNSSSIGRERKRGVPWTEEEHRLFLVGLERVGKGDWRGISRNFVKTRTPTQVASHAQKYFLRRSNLNRRRRRSSLFDITVDMVAASPSEKTLVPRRDNLTMKHPLPPATTTLEAGLPTMAAPLPMPVILPHSLENPSRNLFPGQATISALPCPALFSPPSISRKSEKSLDMCSGSKSKPCPSSFSLAGESQMEQVPCKFSILLELAASDDLTAFKNEVENKGCDVDEPCYWYGRSISSKKMGFSQRTPLMMASMFGSLDVLKYILETGKANVNRASGSDQATALHCAVSGGSHGLHQAVRILLNSDADPTCLDCNGNKPVDLVALVLRPSRRKALKLLLKGEVFVEEEKPVTPEKKEYPVDILLPDINNGMYSSDEFRMYSFKVKPCSRAYSHDWTECPFLHPGENARRRDPRKYPYSCVPCPDFRKGSCPKGDVCEYAHGVFESWLHPAQYKTRLCKDETGCARKVCFFAHKPEELRPVYASTGSALPSPKSFSPQVSPMASQKNMGLWSSPPPALQLPGSRLKASLTARNIDVEMELLGLKNNQLLEEMSRVSSSPSYLNRDFSRLRDLQPTNYEDSLRSLDPTARCHMMPNGGSNHSASQFQSPVGLHIQQNVAQLWPSSLASSPMRTSAFGFNSSSAVATAVMNSRSAAMMKRSLSLIDRASATQEPLSPANSMVQSRFSGWDSGQGDELNKLRKSYSFRNSMNRTDLADEPDVSWVNSLVRDVPQGEQGRENQPKSDIALPWSVDQLYGDQEQIVAI